MNKTPDSGGKLKRSCCMFPCFQPPTHSLPGTCNLDILPEEFQNAKALDTCKDKCMKYFYLTNTTGSKHNLSLLNAMYFQTCISMMIPII